MPPLALGLALAAAVIHACWNLLLARAEDSEAATAVAGVVGAIAFLPLAVLAWDVGPGVWPYVVASAALELLYLALLAGAYSRAELSVVYPIARGAAPVLVLVVGALALGLVPSLGEAAGVGLVAAGILLVRGIRRRGAAPGRAVALALAIAACICGYTLIDREGVRQAAPLAYLWLVLAAPSLVYAAAMWRARPTGALRRALRPTTIAAGLAMYGAFALVLTALTMAPPASVSAVRESSVVVAALLGAVVLREPVGPARLAGAILVALGMALLALA